MSAHIDQLQSAMKADMFLARLPADALQRLLSDATIVRIRRREIVFSAGESDDRVGMVIEGTVRSFMTASDGRRLSVRYARAGAMIGSVTLPRAPLSVQAVSDCTILELQRSTLQEVVIRDGRVGMLLLAEVADRLLDTYATLASNTFGSMRERVARHLLDVSTEGADGEGPTAVITQQGLADAVGTVREVVARTLRDLREEGLVVTSTGRIQILDPGPLAAIVGRDREV